MSKQRNKEQRKPQYEIFARNFSDHFEEWQKRTKGTQESFADLIGTTRKTVSNWMNAINYPQEKLLEAICQTLNVTEQELNVGTIKEYLKYDENFNEDVHRESKEYTDSIGLNSHFMKFMKENISDDIFPLWSTIVETSFDTLGRKYDLEAFQSEGQNEFQRKLEDGKTVNLTYVDYMFMKDVQNEVISYIQFLCYKRKREMEEEVKACQNEYDQLTFVKSNTIHDIAMKHDKYMERLQEVLKNGKHKEKR